MQTQHEQSIRTINTVNHDGNSRRKSVSKNTNYENNMKSIRTINTKNAYETQHETQY